MSRNKKRTRTEADRLKYPSDSVHAHHANKDEDYEFRRTYLYFGEDVRIVSCLLIEM
jgi:hypothetical protein